METYDTVVAAVNALKDRGYVVNFNIAFDKLRCAETGICLNPGEFEIMEIHRFEGNSNPDDEDVVYAVESKDHQVKGIITSAYGLYADPVSSEMIQKLAIHH